MQEGLRNELAKLFAGAGGPDELGTLIEGLLTPQEIEEIVFRWRLILRLRSGQSQREISRDLGVSLGKIARGSRLLKYGPPEFRDLVERLCP